MKKNSLFNLFCILFLMLENTLSLFGQKLAQERVESFIQSLISGSDSSFSYVLPEEITISNRLGIKYQDVPQKYFIASEIDPEVKKRIASGEVTYGVQIQYLEGRYSKATLFVSALNYEKEFFFLGNDLISPARYYSSSWKKKTSKHFVFFVSDPEYFNDYSIKNLETFVDSVSQLLQFTAAQKKKLEKEKIYYFLCKNETEIQNITGFKTLGMYVLANDYVVSMYNCHYHELLHLLMNYKLHSLPLYTQPFFQEGFAVALGGRGGRAPVPILTSGVFLEKSGMTSHKDMLSKQGFQSQDASITYPVSGLYNRFLIQNLGIASYLKLYMKYSAPDSAIQSMNIDTSDFPSEDSWNKYMESFRNNISVNSLTEKGKQKTVISLKNMDVYDMGKDYLFRIKDTIFLSVLNSVSHGKNKVFEENHLGDYGGEKYLLIASKQEVKLYNLFTNNLVGLYVSSFSLPPQEVPFNDGYYEFTIQKNVFEEDIKKLKVK